MDQIIKSNQFVWKHDGLFHGDFYIATPPKGYREGEMKPIFSYVHFSDYVHYCIDNWDNFFYNLVQMRGIDVTQTSIRGTR